MAATSADPRSPMRTEDLRLNINNCGMNNTQKSVITSVRRTLLTLLSRAQKIMNDNSAPVTQYEALLLDLDQPSRPPPAAG